MFASMGKPIINIGCCGSLKKDLPAGKIFIPTRTTAFSTLLYFYNKKKSLPIKNELVKTTEKILKEKNINYQIGHMYSVTSIIAQKKKHITE
jgi:purine-nucleoside phosphorylase|tara:strand:+ start:1761 stop:2036 length:276 start_codon:yes stop_codon:yes gene_type:complete